MLLVGADAQVGARLARTQQNEAGFAVLGKIRVGVRLVHLA